MAITVNFAPNAMLLGQAAYDTGLGEYLLQEQARQQAEQAAAQRQATVAQAGLRPPSQGRGGRDDYLARYAIMQRGALAEQENANQLAALDMRGQYALAEQNMRGQFGLQHEMMQQAGQNQREQWGNVSQSEIARRALIEKQMASDWQNIQKHLPYLNQAERDELIGKYHDRYRDAGMPMPVELPPQAIPEWMDPEAKLRMARESYPNAPWQIDEKGELGLPRGWNYQMDPQFIESQRQHERDMETVKTQDKAKSEDFKNTLKRDAAIDDQQFAREQHVQDKQQSAQQFRATMQMEAMKARMPKESQYTSKNQYNEPVINNDAYMAALEKWQADMEALTDKIIAESEVGGVPQPLNPGAAPPQPTPGVGGEQSAELPAYTPGPKLANPPTMPTPGIKAAGAYGSHGDVYLNSYGSFPGNDQDRGTSSQITSTKLRLGGDVLDPIIRSDNVVLLDKDPKIAKKQLAAIPKGKGFKFLAPDGTIRIVQ